ncbi:peroxiredoxin [Woodsholea maritima]|uniref:peroxiredoxin n=1 Tax=Woodsholea maritima TaxID=240237 RepID=UPI00036C4520|nr:peroxiredoxin [Woodsholea maritima]
MNEDASPSPSLPSAQIDALAPDFEARSTQGLVKLSDYRGRWLVFFSHPADFTPVCTSEFIAFERARAQFEAINTSLLGLSVDSLYAHIAWIKDIEARFEIKIGFPIIEDISMALARSYGMIHAASTNTAAVRSVFVIDPEGYIRAMIHYPMNVGRSVDEILRLLKALQLSDRTGLTTPEGWQAGEDALLAPPMDQGEADTRSGATPWYYTPRSGGVS